MTFFEEALKSFISNFEASFSDKSGCLVIYIKVLRKKGLIIFDTLLLFIILMISVFGYKQGEKWIWNSLFIGILIWFVIDQGFSIAFGVYMNAINNCILFILLITPVIFFRKYFYN